MPAPWAPLAGSGTTGFRHVDRQRLPPSLGSGFHPLAAASGAKHTGCPPRELGGGEQATRGSTGKHLGLEVRAVACPA